MYMNRREFVAATAGLSGLGRFARATRGDDKPRPVPGPTFPADRVVTVRVADGDELQAALHRNVGTGCCVRLERPGPLVCRAREETVGGEKSAHALLVPEGVQLDLNGAELRLDLRSNCYGVRLSSDSAIRNGTVRVVRSEGKGTQGIWHSGVSVGAAYGDGGTTERPGRFSTVRHWAIEDLTIDQPFASEAIAVMSEACHGIIRGVRILDSPGALLGIGMDWGSVGPITTADETIPRMRRLWEAGEIYSTHPHDITVERIRVGKLRRNVDPNDAGLRCAACHRITIRDLEVEEAATALALFGGDLGYEYAREDQRAEAHTGYVVDGVRIARALQYALVLNGSADNVWRVVRDRKYDAVRDPVHPGLDRPVLRDVVLRGSGAAGTQGVYAVAVSGATLDRLDVEGFHTGVHVEDWVRGMRFRDLRLAGNTRDLRIEGATEPPVGVEFDPMPKG